MSKGITLKSERSYMELPETWIDDPGASRWDCTLKYSGRRETFEYFMGSMCDGEPKLSDLLESLFLDASAEDEDFEDWATDLGYNPDSRKAEAIYNACIANTKKLRRLLEDDFDDFRNVSDEISRGEPSPSR